MYIVHTCLYMYIQVYKCFDSYKHVHIMYILVHTCLLLISYVCQGMQCTAVVFSSLGVVPASSWQGQLNPLDTLMLCCQDCLQLLLELEGIRLHFGIYIYHHNLVLKCLCIVGVLEIGLMMRAFQGDYILYFLTNNIFTNIHLNFLKCIQILQSA